MKQIFGNYFSSVNKKKSRKWTTITPLTINYLGFTWNHHTFKKSWLFCFKECKSQMVSSYLMDRKITILTILVNNNNWTKFLMWTFDFADVNIMIAAIKMTKISFLKYNDLFFMVYCTLWLVSSFITNHIYL